ncbi:hypothetical protein AAVH_29600 [Aphelenchoides avenae]|nr:hypothetical protein AAVH_29600 [Aphelenchus avenae]
MSIGTTDYALSLRDRLGRIVKVIEDTRDAMNVVKELFDASGDDAWRDILLYEQLQHKGYRLQRKREKVERMLYYMDHGYEDGYEPEDAYLWYRVTGPAYLEPPLPEPEDEE